MPCFELASSLDEKISYDSNSHRVGFALTSLPVSDDSFD